MITKEEMSGNCAEENPSFMSEVGIGRLVVDLRKAKGSQVTASCSQGKSFSKYTTHLFFGAWYSKIIPIKVASEWILNYFPVDFNNRNLPFLLHESLSLCLFTPASSQKIFFALCHYMAPFTAPDKNQGQNICLF